MNYAEHKSGKQTTPPSFAPSQGSAHRTAHKFNRPETIHPGGSDHRRTGSTGLAAHEIPPAFSPSRGKKNAGQGRNQTAPAAPRSARAMRQPQKADNNLRQSTPEAPVIQPRRSSGSSAVVTSRSSAGTEGQRAIRASQHHDASMLRGHGTPPAKPTRTHHHRIIKTLMAFIVLLLVAAALLLFGAWNWVDSRLNKADWSTGSSNSIGTAWLVLGSDERDGLSSVGTSSDVSGYRTDTILVLTKPLHGPASLISIPRDSLVKQDGEEMKINAVAQRSGTKALVTQVEDITGKNIDHVAQIKFEGLQGVVDAIGGVDLCYDNTVSDPDSGLNWQAGCHTADGPTALAFSRMRYSDPTGDFGRAKRQRMVIGAIMKKALSKEVLSKPATVKKLASTALDAVQVDNHTNPKTLVDMAMAFKGATGTGGISGSVYWTDPDYYVDSVGSSVLLDRDKNLDLFESLATGSHKPGTVGSLAGDTSQ